MCDVLLVVVKELEVLAEAEVAELVLVRANVDSLKQDMSPRTSKHVPFLGTSPAFASVNVPL